MRRHVFSLPVTSPVLTSLLCAVLAAGGLAMGGCSGSSQTAEVDVRYEAALDSTTYQAGPVSVTEPTQARRTEASAGSVTGRGGRSRRQRRPRTTTIQQRRLQMSVHARCPGKDCTPRHVDVTFRSTSNRQFVRPGAPLSLQMSGRQYEWESPDLVSPVPGASDNVVASVTMTWTQFQELAQSEIVAGSLGDFSFESEYDERAPLRRLTDEAGL